MALTTQPSLLDLAEVPDGDDDAAAWSLGAVADGLERHVLAHGAWVDVRRGWLRGSDGVLATLLAEVPWRAERRQMYEREVDVPRLLRFYGEGEALPHACLAAARDALSAHYVDELAAAGPLRTAGLCLYRDGRDGVAWHGDRTGRSRREDTVVAIVSFGAPRPLLLRPAGGGPTALRVPVGHGDLLVMGGSCQRTWEHAVPKTTQPVGPRVSVQLRQRGVR